MKPRERSKISPEQRQVIEKYLADIPVKLGSLARELGVSAVKIASMKTGVSGQITKEDDKYIIRVNRNEARERQRFTIAHELAHYLLHRQVIDQFRDGITDNVLYRSGAPERIEYEANKLAADLVMPEEMIRRILESDFKGTVTEATIEKLAAYFEVSKAAMELRLRESSVHRG